MSGERDKILRFYRGTEGEEAAIRLTDLAQGAQKSQTFRLSGFLTPYEQDIATTVAANFPNIKVDFSGGYGGAERQRAVFADADFAGTPSFAIAVVKAVWRGEFVRLSHRDVLGAVMNVGLSREVVGDIIATGEWAKILVDEKTADYFCQNLTQIGGAKVTTTIDDLADIAPKEERTKDIKATVASLRIDSITAAGFGISRSKAATDIGEDKVKLNWHDVKNAAQAVKEGDVLSMRGRGRLEVVTVGGTTKKGRISVLLRRYI